jgi:hypothetical protein
MGITDAIILGLAKKIIGKTVTSIKDLSPEQRKAIEEAYNKGVIDGSKNNGNDEDYKKPVNTTTTGAGFTGAGPFVDLIEAKKKLESAFNPETISGAVDELIKGAQGLGNSMGIGRARAEEFRSMIADTVPEMQKLGFDQNKTLEIMQDIPKTLGVNTTLTKETIVEIGSASKFSGQEAGVLANNFKGVGINLADVGDEMAKAANYAKSVGVNVKAVTNELVTNLKNLNLFNFEGGVQGLTKMVAQSKMLGINMDAVFRKADDLLNPESAIEFSSALQRLGVQSSALLDPLSAMDMALNDPAALQNEMVKVSQQFTRLKADGSGFEILPGAKLQLREVAKSMGMTADELANMSIKSADLDMKMSQIRFPGFAASEEDKMLIANMAQMKDGRAMVTIANEGGGTDEVAVEDLTAEQLEKLKEEQADQNKTAEEIAREQLTVLEEIAAQIGGTATAATMGAASAGAVQRMTNTVNEMRRSVSSVVSEKITTEKVRKAVGGPLGDVEKGAVNALAQGDVMALIRSLGDAGDKIIGTANDLGSGLVDGTKQIVQKMSAAVLEQYKDVGGVKPGQSDIEKTLLGYLDELQNKTTTKETETSKTNSFNVNQNIDVKGTSDQITRENVFKWNDEWWSEVTKDPSKMNKAIEGIDKSMSGSGMAK